MILSDRQIKIALINEAVELYRKNLIEMLDNSESKTAYDALIESAYRKGFDDGRKEILLTHLNNEKVRLGILST